MLKISFWSVFNLLVKISLIIVLCGIILFLSLIIYYNISASLVKEEKITDSVLLAMVEQAKKEIRRRKDDTIMIRAVINTIYKYSDENYLVVYDWYEWHGKGKRYMILDESGTSKLGGGISMSWYFGLRGYRDEEELLSTKERLKSYYGEPDILYQRSEVKP